MINSKRELREYLEADRIALGRSGNSPAFFDIIWKYEIALRKSEYYHNIGRGFFNKILAKYWGYRVFSLGVKCGYHIGRNCVGKGLSLAHIGPVIINSAAIIGDNCRIHVGVNIGTAAGTKGQAPVIGNNVYIGPGAKLFGPIKIGNGIVIGANAVVNKSFECDNITLAGVPAKIIKRTGSADILNLSCSNI